MHLKALSSLKNTLEMKNRTRRQNTLIYSALSFIIAGSVLGRYNDWFLLIALPGILMIIYISYLNYVEN